MKCQLVPFILSAEGSICLEALGRCIRGELRGELRRHELKVLRTRALGLKNDRTSSREKSEPFKIENSNSRVNETLGVSLALWESKKD